MPDILFTNADLARIVKLPPQRVHGWNAWLEPASKRPGGAPLFDRIGIAAALIFNELHREGGMEAGPAREAAELVQSGDEERMRRWWLAGRRARGELEVDLFADLDDEDIAELRGSKLYRDTRSLLELRAAMLEKVDVYERGAGRLANAPE